jgi:hypothetical protein
MRLRRQTKRFAPWLAAGLAVCGILRVATVRERLTLVAAEQPRAENIPLPSPAAQQTFGFVGTASCSAANCHGGDASRPARPGTPLPDPLSPHAYSIWIQRDAHAFAYSTLLSPASREIAARLGLMQGAHLSQECLSCHSPLSQRQLAPHERFTAHDGVSCEACHGPAEKWLDLHKWDAWRAKSPDEKAADGFRNTDDLAARAKLCAECHVGSEGRDVNHDLIAAGHPRMSFELSAYHANLQKHWSREDAEPSETIDAKLWQVGQIASAEAALTLLQSRAARETAPWPEFSEYDCFACHHELRDPSWRQIRGFPHGAGAFPWGTWYFSMLREALPPSGSVSDVEPIINGLAAEMGRPYPNREAVMQAAQRARAVLAGALPDTAARRMSRQDAIALLKQLAQASPTEGLESWDATSQQFLAASAVYHSAASLADGSAAGASDAREPITRELQSIREKLLFPQADDQGRYLSPRNFDSEAQREIAESFAAIRGALENW